MQLHSHCKTVNVHSVAPVGLTAATGTCMADKDEGSGLRGVRSWLQWMPVLILLMLTARHRHDALRDKDPETFSSMQGTNVELQERIALLEVNVNKAQAKLQEEQASCTLCLNRAFEFSEVARW